MHGGDYDVRVPVLSSDELGELSAAFNRMASGLAEREQIRDVFCTLPRPRYRPLILSGQAATAGASRSRVSIMFLDVPGFTSFAERALGARSHPALNTLFEVLVPAVARHGGHVDKFIGDGLLAVFGAPEGFPDHADRAVAAGLEVVRAVNVDGAELLVGVGINTGVVIAGSIGGAGRLNFSVIGDAVNVCARVEAATRDTGDHLLLTAATRDALTQRLPLNLARDDRAEGQGRARRGPGLRKRGDRATRRPPGRAGPLRSAHASDRSRPAGASARRGRAQPEAHR